MKKIATMSLVLAAFLHTAWTSELEIPNDYRVSFLLPIDWSSPAHRDLQVSIPKEYQSIQPSSSWETAALIEFIPKNENSNHWSEIISISKIIGKGISALQFTSLLQQRIASSAAKAEILFEEKSKDTSTFIIKYIDQNQEEVMGAKYFSGPYDCVGVQYTIRLKQGQSQSNAVAKIKTFFQTNLTQTHQSG